METRTSRVYVYSGNVLKGGTKKEWNDVSQKNKRSCRKEGRRWGGYMDTVLENEQQKKERIKEL